MKIKAILPILLAVVLGLAGISNADYVIIINTGGSVFTVDEYDLNGTGEISNNDFAKTISSAAGNRSSGEIVLGFADGTAAVVQFNALNTVLTSGTIETGGNLLGTCIRPDGNVIFTSAAGWAHARDHATITAAPSGYTADADVRISDANYSNMFVPQNLIQDEVLLVGWDLKETWIRQGEDMSAAPGGYLNDHMYWDSYITSWALTPDGDVVLGMGNTAAQVFVRDNADMSLAPAGYLGSGKTFGTGVRSVAMAVSQNGYLVYGNDSGEVFVRHVSDLNNADLDGFASTYTSDMAVYSGIKNIAITSHNNVVIALYDGKIFVRSLYDINGVDVAPMTVRYTQSGGIATLITMPGGMALSCSDLIARGRTLNGDMNADCYVNLEDFAVLGQHWLECNDPENEDCD